MSSFSSTHSAFLMECLRGLLGDVQEAELQAWRSRLDELHLSAGQVLITEGDPGDDMYLLLSGRLRVSRGETRQVVGEMTRGEFIGEMSMFTDQPRSATVVAVRDSVLARLAKRDFPYLLESSSKVSISITRRIIERLDARGRASQQAKPVTVALMPICERGDFRGFALSLQRHLSFFGRTCIVDRAGVIAAGHGSAVQSQLLEPLSGQQDLSLDDIEASHDFVLLLADPQPTEWTQRCARQSDETLLLADATCPPALHANETHPGTRMNAGTGAAEVLVLMHPAQSEMPRGTAGWLERRPVADHLHIRPALDRDMARLARVVSRNAVGLVLSGGGARGMSHLGVWRALVEQGIDVDYVGGTSIGSIMTALVASDRPLPMLQDVAREALGANPTGDFNPLPVLSLVKGQRVRRVIKRVVERLLGPQADIEDLWKNAFCVATNFSTASEDVARRGPLERAILASIAIPGALPPVLRDGHLLCDGGTLNNFPVDVMRRLRGVRRVIGVDLGGTERLTVDLDEVPSPWQLFLDRLRPAARRRYALPTFMGYLINALLLHSMSRQRLAAHGVDLYFKPALGKVGLLEWKKAADIEARGYESAREVLSRLPPQELRLWQATGTG